MMYKGQLSLARNHLDQALALFDPSAHKLLTFQFGQHPGAASEALLSVTLWLLGYPDQASSISNKAITLARQLDHVNTFGYVLSFGQLVSQMARNVSQVEKLAEIVISYAKEHKLALYLGASTMMQGWALINRGEAAESVSRVSNGLAAWRATGANLFVSQFQAYLVEGYLALGQIKDGLETVQDILSFVKESDEHYWEAEIYRLQGELQRRQGQETKAETGFQQAIAVAQQQNAKSLELRASVSLARLYQQRGKRIEAYHMLAEIFNWFTEGFDTVDLKEARALLEELRLGTIPGPS